MRFPTTSLLLLALANFSSASSISDAIPHNIFSDLGPLVALLGNHLALQHLTNATSTLHTLTIALLPLGLLTIFLSAIRLAGPSWLRQLTGRAHEPRAKAERDLLTSTSEVTERWNGTGVERVVGKNSNTRQIVYLRDEKDDPNTMGLYTVEGLEGVYVRSANSRPFSAKKQEEVNYKDEESSGSDGPQEKYRAGVGEGHLPTNHLLPGGHSVNMTLNTSPPYSTPWLVFIVALIAQIAVLAFAAISVYLPTLSRELQIEPARNAPDYAFPLLAAGTVLLSIGVFLCASVVSGSVQLTEVSRPNGLNARLLWVQPEASKESTIVFGPNKFDTQTANRVLLATHDLNYHPIIPTTVGVLFGVVGFIAQFQAFRSLNYLIAIAQLLALLLVSFLRSRQTRSTDKPVGIPVPTGHELDYLALQIADDFGTDDRMDIESRLAGDCPFWPSPSSNESEGAGPKRRKWWITSSNLPNLASGKAQHAVDVRKRLTELTGYSGTMSEVTKGVCESIEMVMDSLAAEATADVEVGEAFTWAVDVGVEDERGKVEYEKVEFEVIKEEGGWKADKGSLEAALGLWSYHVQQCEGRLGGLDDKAAAKRKIERILGRKDELEDSLRRDLKWWGRDTEVEDRGLSGCSLGSCRCTGGHTLGVIGLAPNDDEDPGHDNEQTEEYLIASAEAPIGTLLAQHIFTSFMLKFAEQIEPTWATGETTVGNGRPDLSIEDPTLFPLQIQNKAIQQIAKQLQTSGIATTPEDASLCILPSFSHFDRLPIDFIEHLRQLGLQHEQTGKWATLLPVYSKLFRECFSPASQERTLKEITAMFLSVFTSFHRNLNRREAQLRLDELPPLKKLQAELLEIYGLVQEDEELPLTPLFEIFASIFKQQQRFDPLTWTLLHIPEPQVSNGSTLALTSVDDVDILGWSALHYAALHADIDKVRSLIRDEQADADWTDLSGYSPLHYAVEKLSDEEKVGRDVVATLIRAPANVNLKGRDGWTALHIAAERERLAFALALINAGADIEAQDDLGQTPLHRAAWVGREKMVKFLLDAGADKFAQDSYGRTPLCLAAMTKKHTAVDELIRGYGLRMRKVKVDNDERTPLHFAAMAGNVEATRSLCVMSGIDVDAKDRFGRTALYYAIERGHRNTARILILEGSADIGASDEKRRSPLHLAVEMGDDSMIRTLIDIAKGGIDVKMEGGYTPLHLAAMLGRKTAARLLLAGGADVEAKDNWGNTPLHLAVMKGHQALVEFLLLAGRAKINSRCKSGFMAIHKAIFSSPGLTSDARCCMVRLLLLNGASGETTDSDGDTPLHLTAYKGDVQTAEMLITQDHVQLEPRNNDNRTPLYCAILSEQPQDRKDAYIRLLLRLGADINARGKGETTALHLACRSGHASVVRVLLEEKADPDLGDEKGVTPLMVGCAKGHEEIVRILLEEGGANPNAVCAAGMTALHYILRSNTDVSTEVKLRLIDLLIARGADVNAIDDLGRTPLHYAAEKGYTRLAEKILQHGAIVDAVDYKCETALMISAYCGHTEFAYMLLDDWRARIEIKDSLGWTVLHNAVENKLGGEEKAAFITRLLEEGGCREIVDEKSLKSNTALHFAVRKAFNEAVLALLRGGADVDARGENDATPLHLACLEGHVETARILIAEGGADVLAVTNKGHTVLHKAVESEVSDEERGRLMRMLLSNGCDKAIEVKDNEGKTPLHMGSIKGTEQAVLAMLEAGAQVDNPDDEKDTALHLATMHGQTGIAAILCGVGKANTEAKCDSGSTPMHHALTCDMDDDNDLRFKMIKNLLEEGASDPNVVDAGGNTSLHLVARSKDTAIAQLLVKAGAAELERRNDHQNTALHVAVLNNQEDMVRLLIDSGANPELPDGDADRPLQLATMRGYFEVAEMLVSEGFVDINSRGDDDCTALHYAVKTTPEHLKIRFIKLLLATPNIDVNARDIRGNTALHIAAESGFENISRMLLAAGCDANAQNNDGCTPLVVSVIKNHQSVARVLLAEYGADVNLSSNDGLSPVRHALNIEDKDYSLDMVRTLVTEFGADVFRDGEEVASVVVKLVKKNWGEQVVEELFGVGSRRPSLVERVLSRRGSSSGGAGAVGLDSDSE